MNLSKISIASALVLGLLQAGTAYAAIMFDQDVTPDVIFGGGNANGGFTTDSANGIELGLRAKLRYDAAGNPQNIFNSNGDGTYSFDAGVGPGQSSPTAIWNFEWSINSDSGNGFDRHLSDLTYVLSLDSDPGPGAAFVSFDPINTIFADHAFGNNGTPNGGGTEATTIPEYAALIDSSIVAQNSWQMGTFIPGFDPTVAGVYGITLAAFSPTSGIAVASTRIQVIVGNGAPVPAPASLLLFGTGLMALRFRKSARRRS